MVDPSMKWIHSLDSHYHDQAQFVREFKHFMLMRPSDYAAMDHPIALTAVRARRTALGQPMQVLHKPERSLEPRARVID
jgi:AraC-like DNA-binding protein